MVTMRRDVAAVAANGIFDRVDRDSALTDYDIFMRDKMRNEENSNAVSKASRSDASYSVKEMYGYPYGMVKEPEAEDEYADYGEYMRAQLNRKSADKLLSKEEFYQAKFNSSSAVKVAPKARKSKRHMTKAGKIFTLVYVLMVIAVASIIIAVNNSSDGGSGVSASADAATGEIKALTVETREIEGNWFDDLLDGISNK